MRGSAKRRATVLAALVAACSCGPVARATANEVPPPFDPSGWRLVHHERFNGKIDCGREGGWVSTRGDAPLDVLRGDGAPAWGPQILALEHSFEQFRKTCRFGQGRWLTAQLRARAQGTASSSFDSYQDADRRPSITTERLPGAGKVLDISTPNFTGGAIVTSTRPLPRVYRIEYHLKTIDYGGERNGTLAYDGKYNGYRVPSPGQCKTFFPWAQLSQPWSGPSLEAQKTYPADPCAWGSVMNADATWGYNSFHYLGIVDQAPVPQNLVYWHKHRKVFTDSYANVPGFIADPNVGSDTMCDPATKTRYPYSEGTRNVIDMSFEQPYGGSGDHMFINSCVIGQPLNTHVTGAAEIQPELMPGQDYTFAIERSLTGYTFEVTGNFRRGGHRTLRYHRDFVEKDAEGREQPINHYNQTPGEYDGRFDTSVTVNGVTIEHTWPAGSAYPDYFIIGQPYTNAGEGSATIDDVELYVPRHGRGHHA